MEIRRAALTLVTVVGLLAVAVCAYYLVGDWQMLDSAYPAFQRAAAAKVGLQDLFLAYARQDIHRVNCFTDGVGLLLGALIAAVGLHGLCLLPAAAGQKAPATGP